MNLDDYDDVVRYVGRHLARPHRWPVPITVPVGLNPAKAVYVACSRRGVCLNVGSVARAGSGLAARVHEHLVDDYKRRTWHHLWVLPLKESTPLSDVRRLEGVVGAHLGPTDNRWLPAPGPAGWGR
jgi:hypothetical protein